MDLTAWIKQRLQAALAASAQVSTAPHTTPSNAVAYAAGHYVQLEPERVQAQKQALAAQLSRSDDPAGHRTTSWLPEASAVRDGLLVKILQQL